MKTNLAAMLRNAAACIPPKKDDGAYRFALEEVADHVDMVRRAEASVQDFADLYLTPLDPTAINR